MAELDEETKQKDKKVNLIMLGVFGALTLVCCCGGAAVAGIAGADSEQQGMEAAMGAAGPACCSISGLLTVLLGTFAFKGKTTLKIVAPFAVGIVGGLLGALGTYLFFAEIWPSL